MIASTVHMRATLHTNTPPNHVPRSLVHPSREAASIGEASSLGRIESYATKPEDLPRRNQGHVSPAWLSNPHAQDKGRLGSLIYLRRRCRISPAMLSVYVTLGWHRVEITPRCVPRDPRARSATPA